MTVATNVSIGIPKDLLTETVATNERSVPRSSENGRQAGINHERVRWLVLTFGFWPYSENNYFRRQGR